MYKNILLYFLIQIILCTFVHMIYFQVEVQRLHFILKTMEYIQLEPMRVIYLNVTRNGAHFLCKNLKLTKCLYIELIIINMIRIFIYRAVVTVQSKYGKINQSKCMQFWLSLMCCLKLKLINIIFQYVPIIIII